MKSFGKNNKQMPFVKQKSAESVLDSSNFKKRMDEVADINKNWSDGKAYMKRVSEIVYVHNLEKKSLEIYKPTYNDKKHSIDESVNLNKNNEKGNSISNNNKILKSKKVDLSDV